MAVQRTYVGWPALLVAGLVAGLVVALAPQRASAAEALPDGDFVAVYDGELTTSWGGSARANIPAQPTTKRPSVLELTCRQGRCTYAVTTPAGSDLTARTTQASTVRSRTTRTYDPWASVRDICPEFALDVTTVLTADAQEATLRSSAPGVEKRCSDGSFASTGKWVRTFEGSLTDLRRSRTTGPDEDEDDVSAGSTDEGAGSSPGRPVAAGATAAGLGSGAADAPSVLSSLPVADDVSLGSGRGLALLVIILVLLIAFPTHLLNLAVDSGQEKLGAFRRRRLGLPPDASDAPPVSSARTWAVAAGVVLAASIISAFVDPGFGLNAGSARVLASLVLALAVETLLVWFLVIRVTRRVSPGTIAGFHAAPATLLVVVLAVVLTRLTGFEPGIVFGLVAGVTFAATSGAASQGRVALAGAGLALALALAGWVGYSVLGAATSSTGFARTFATETLAGLAIAGIASLPLALIPLRGLAGHTLYAWSKPLWAGCYAVGLVGFFVVLMPMPFSWAEVGLPLRTWVLLYVGYATAAVLAWALLTRPWHKDTAAPAV